MSISIRQILQEKLQEKLSSKVAELKEEIASFQLAQQQETKSSAGDKYETSREMIAQEIQKLATQLEATKEKMGLLKSLEKATQSSIIALGSVIWTNRGNYFLVTPEEAIFIDQEKFFCISIFSPIGKLLLGKKADDEFIFNQQSYCIQKII